MIRPAGPLRVGLGLGLGFPKSLGNACALSIPMTETMHKIDIPTKRLSFMRRNLRATFGYFSTS